MAAFRALLAVLAAAWLLAPGAAQASNCLAFVERAPGVVPAGVVPASLAPAQGAEAVRITYVGHSTFRIRSPAGVVIATDYAGDAGPGPLPDVVTMNHAHTTHYTDTPEPGIEHVLRGWNPAGGRAVHDVAVGDVRIRNVTTDIRAWSEWIEPDGNSIFIFEVADLCIAHLGHLHQKLSAQQLGLVGRLDVVFVPIDGSYTMAQSAMIEVLRDLRASLVIPMHYFGPVSLASFLDAARAGFDVEFANARAIEVSLETLPRQPTVMVLEAN